MNPHLRDEIKEKLIALNERSEAMTAEEIETAIKMRFLHFGSYTVERRVSRGGRTRVFSSRCDVYLCAGGNGPMRRVSPPSGWEIEKAAREVFNRLQNLSAVPAHCGSN